MITSGSYPARRPATGGDDECPEERLLGLAPGEPIEVHLGTEVRVARWVETYAEAKPSELVLLVDSYGLTSLALDRASAAAAYRLRPGSGVTLVPPGATVTAPADDPPS